MANSAFSNVFGLLFWLFAARTMPANEIGLAAASLAVGALVYMLALLGMDAGLIRYLPQSADKDDLYNSVLVANFLMSLVFVMAFLGGLAFFSPALLYLRQWNFLLAFLVYIVLNSATGVQSLTLLSLRRGDLLLVQNLLLGFRLIFLFFFASLGFLGIYYSFDLALVIAFVVGEVLLHLHGISFKFHFNPVVLRKIARFSLGNYVAAIFAFAPTVIIPLIIINTIGATSNAYFYIAYSIASVMLLMPSAVATSLFIEGSHNVPLKQVTIRSFKFIFALLIPALIVVIVFGGKLLLLFGAEYSVQSLRLLQLLACSSLLSAVTTIYIHVKKVQKNIKMVNFLSIFVSVLTIVFCYGALAAFGLIGVGYAWIIANAILCGIVLWLLAFRETWGGASTISETTRETSEP